MVMWLDLEPTRQDLKCLPKPQNITPSENAGKGLTLMRLELFFDSGTPGLAEALKTLSSAIEGARVIERRDGADEFLLSTGPVQLVVAKRASPEVPIKASQVVHRYGIADATELTLDCGLCVTPDQDGDWLGVDALQQVVRAGLALAGFDGCLAVAWSPAASLMGRDYFVKTSENWLAGGAFPVLGLVALRPEEDGTMVSRGLTAISGYEVVVAPSDQMVRADQAKLAIRFIDHIVREGPLQSGETIDLVDFGEVSLKFSDENQYIYLKN